jgi:hypothetical protein
MSETKFSNFTNEDGSTGPDLVGITSFTSPYYFVPPSGTTAQRPSGEGLAPGMLRFNTDIGRLEVWRGDHWATILGESPNLGVNGALGARALFFRGNTDGPTTNVNVIDYITVSTLGNAQDFGDDLTTSRQPGALASSTRALAAGRDSVNDTISFVTISSTGDGQDFANLVSATGGSPAGISNEIRGIFAGGISPGATAKMDYVTIASQGTNAQDFGDLNATRDSPFGCASSVRGIVAGGFTPSPGTKHASIDYITMSSTGNAQDFGDMTSGTDHACMASNSTRGVFAGGRAPGLVNTIEFITIASTGNAQDFGDLLQVRAMGAGAASSTRIVFAGGYNPSSPSNNFTNGAIEYVEIATTGNSIGFGDLFLNRSQCRGASNGHGGL